MSDILKSFPLSCLDAGPYPEAFWSPAGRGGSAVQPGSSWRKSPGDGSCLCIQGSSAPLSGHLIPLPASENPWLNCGSQATCALFLSSGTDPLDVCLSGEGTVGWSKELVGTASKAVFFPP